MNKIVSLLNGRTLAVMLAVGVAGYLSALDQIDGHGHFHPDAAEAANAADFDPAPPFALDDLRAREVSLASYRGGWVFVNFWANWCPPCIAEMPSIERMYQKLGKTANLSVLALHSGPIPPGEVRGFAMEKGLTFPILLDEEQSATRAYGVTRFPMTFIVNPQGLIVAYAAGPRDWDGDDMIAYLKELMSAYSGTGK